MSCTGATCTATPLPEPTAQDHVPAGLSQSVVKNVLKQLGKPADLHSVQAVQIYGNKWRVNVRRKLDDSRLVPTVSITDSFHLTADDEGNVLTDIANKYGIK